MNVNTAIWGDPSIWFHRSANPQITANCTISEMRIGCANYSDADFTEYPATKFCRDICLFGYWRDGYLNPDGETPLDNTLSYTAIANPDLPQMDLRVATVGTTADWGNQALMQSRPSEPVPFSLATYRDYGQTYNPSYRSGIYGIDGFNNDASMYAQQGFLRWCPFGRYDKGADIGNVRFGEYNPNGRLGMLGEFGVKSVILEIHVSHYAGGLYPSETRTLKSYMQQSDAWKETHPILSAYCIPYWRINKNGTYSSSIPIGYTADNQMVGVSPVFYRTLYSNATARTYTSYLMGGHGQDVSGYFPIYGRVVNDSMYTSDYVTANAYEHPSQTTQSNGVFFYGCQRGKLKKSGTSFKLELEGTDENIEWIMKGAAAYGLFFCTEIGTLGNSGRDADRWVDNNMYLGIIRSDGMTYGEYSHGLDNAEQQQYGWKSSTETPYVPGQNTNIYSQQTRIKAIGHIDTMTKRYVLDSNAIQAMAVDMFAIMSDLSEQGTNWGDLMSKSLDAFLVQNPIDCIVSLKKYPVKNIPKNNTLVNIQYGRYTSGSAAAYECLADVYTYAFTPREIQPRFGRSFLDYEPYTSAELFIPYCGTVNLRMCDILGKTLQPFICVDFYTGQCTGFVMCDGIVIETIQGTIAVDVPVTGIQTATIEGQLQNAANISRQARVNQFAQYAKSGLIVGAATFVNPAAGAAALAAQIKGTMNTWLQKNQADYNLTHTEAPQHIIGTSSSACSWIIDADTARLILYYPGGGVIDDDLPPNFDAAALAEFISLNGVATIETGQIKNYPGVTSGCKPMLTGITTENGIPASDEELKLIEDAIFDGLIVPVS